jgi:Fe-S-cluster-containing dehydrogenase component
VRTCPTEASHIIEGGIVLVDRDLCIGCGACIEYCPYDARYRHPEYGVVDKCTFCIHRVKKGQDPACVSVCPTNCMYFGDLDDSNSKVAQLLAERKYKVLAKEAGTSPNVYYLI